MADIKGRRREVEGQVRKGVRAKQGPKETEDMEQALGEDPGDIRKDKGNSRNQVQDPARQTADELRTHPSRIPHP